MNWFYNLKIGTILIAAFIVVVLIGGLAGAGAGTAVGGLTGNRDIVIPAESIVTACPGC